RQTRHPGGPAGPVALLRRPLHRTGGGGPRAFAAHGVPGLGLRPRLALPRAPRHRTAGRRLIVSENLSLTGSRGVPLSHWILEGLVEGVRMSVTGPDVKSIFGQAMALASPGERAAYLQQACAGDPELRGEIESLLQADQDAGSFLGQREPGPVATVEESISEYPGSVIGPYKLVEQIGEGGMGTVWMAQQTEPVRRLVAIKLI